MANGLAFSSICNKSIGMFSFYSLIFLSPSMKVLARPLGLAFFCLSLQVQFASGQLLGSQSNIPLT